MESHNVYTIKSMKPGENDDLSQIFERATNGDKEALSVLYSGSFDKIFRFIYYRVSHLETAEDLTEEVFVKAFKKLKQVKKPDSFKPWLYQIARNTVIDYYRSKKVTVDLEEVENTAEYQDNVIDTLNLNADQEVLIKALDKLPTEQRIVIKLKFFEDLNNAEISELLHKSEGAIRVIQFRAINKLRELLKNLL